MGVPGLAPCGTGEPSEPECNPLYDEAVVIRSAVAAALVVAGWDPGVEQVISHGPAAVQLPNCDQLDVWVSSVARIPLLQGQSERLETTYTVRLSLGCWPTVAEINGEAVIPDGATQEYAAKWSYAWATAMFDALLALKPHCKKKTFVVSPLTPGNPQGGCASWTATVKW